MKERVMEVLDKIRPVLQRDGGDIELISVEGDTVTVRLIGACAGCPASTMTLKGVVEDSIKEAIPEIKNVIAIQ